MGILSIVITVLIGMGLAWNHHVHGWGCWGVQPGGHASDQLDVLQLLVATVVCVHAIVCLLRGRYPGSVWIVVVVLMSLAGMIGLHVTDGWTIGTSIHFQGPENLIPFGAASVTAIVGGVASIVAKMLQRAREGMEEDHIEPFAELVVHVGFHVVPKFDAPVGFLERCE